VPTQQLGRAWRTPAPASESAIAARLLGPLRESPVTLPALAALALFVAWATDDGGYQLTHWAPGGLIVLVLVAVAAGFIGWRPAELPRAVLLALACFAAYTGWSFLSIVWASAPGTAFEGADRTLLYLLVFALFAGFRLQGAAAALLLCAWTLAIVGVAVSVLLHLNGLGAAGLSAAFPGGRLVYPAGYVNAAAAQWMIAAWPAALLARSERLHPALRGLLAAGAVLLTAIALLSLSRGATIASAIVLVLVFVFVPRRLRTFAVLVPITLGIAASAPALLRVGDRLEGGLATAAALHGAQSALHAATVTTVVAALLVGLAVGVAATFEERTHFSPRTQLRTRHAIAALAAAALVGVLGAGLALAGNPVTRLHHAWDTFKSPRGYEANAGGNRLISGLGSNRYDFYRVALDEFAAHPVLGIGADNFAQQYLRHGQSSETPRYPHSVELRTLAETGLIGAALALLGLGAALLAGARAMRRAGPLGGAVAAAALGGFGYWLVHGSADWFWEYAGLAAPAFALLGIACALDPGGRPLASGHSGPRWLDRAMRRRAAYTAACVMLGLAAAFALALPWLSELEVQSAAAVWAKAPSTAYARLRSAADLDPLSAEADLVAGSIALRYGELARADHEFSLALGRSPDDQYATLERGAIASQRGESARALRLLARAVYLYPRDPLATEALALTRAGQRVSVSALNTAILSKAQQLE
jgi:tetratricopeptide (TPR) repeat protein